MGDTRGKKNENVDVLCRILAVCSADKITLASYVVDYDAHLYKHAICEYL